jgi:hypothetical protein
VKRREKKERKEKRQQKVILCVFAPLWQEKIKIVFIRKKTNKGAIIPLLN